LDVRIIVTSNLPVNNDSGTGAGQRGEEDARGFWGLSKAKNALGIFLSKGGEGIRSGEKKRRV